MQLSFAVNQKPQTDWLIQVVNNFLWEFLAENIKRAKFPILSVLWRPSSCEHCTHCLCADLVAAGWTAMCPYGGWLYSQNSCYNFFNAKFTRTWEDARQRCLEQDADLVTIETTPERVSDKFWFTYDLVH